MTADIVLFGAHPDDVEWGAGGIMMLLKAQGVSFAVVDLTNGEAGSRGTSAERKQEAHTAGAHAGAIARESLGMPDTAVADTPEARKQIAAVIRRYRPKLVLAPYWEDRHPDHAGCGLLVRNSALYCALKNSPDPNPPHKPDAFLYYLLHGFDRPNFVVDISSVYAQKLKLLRLHSSQFAKTADQYGVVPLGMSDYLYGLESRDRFFGSLVGVHHGEALVSDRPFRLSSVSSLLGLL